MKYKFDYLIKKYINKLPYGFFQLSSMDYEDCLQYGRLECFLAEKIHYRLYFELHKETFLKKHLKFRFIDLMRKSIGKKNLFGKTSFSHKKNKNLNQAIEVPINSINLYYSINMEDFIDKKRQLMGQV